MTVTIKDVARLAGVSISTVSRVINDSKPVSPEVRKRVLEIIEQVGYKPNEIARTLVTKKSYLIGVIVTDIGNSYVAQMVRGIEEVGKMYNYDILLCSSYGDQNAELKFVQLLNRKQVEGIILISDILNNDLFENINQYKFPLVYLNRYYYKQGISTVSIDVFDAAYEMTNFLINLGHNKIAYVGINLEGDSLEKTKESGYRRAISEHELENEIVFYTNGNNIQDGYDIAKDIVNNSDNVTAVFCGCDEIAIGIMNYCYDNNIKIPEKLSIAGFGGTNIGSIFRPKLTTIKEPFYDIGAVAIRKIIKELKGEKLEANDVILPFQILKRDSCKKIK